MAVPCLSRCLSSSVFMTYLSVVPVLSQKCFGLDNEIDSCSIKYMAV